MVTKKKPENEEIQLNEKNEYIVKKTTAVGPTESFVSPVEQLIYIGPTIRKYGIGIRTNQVYTGGHPEYFKALYEAYPHLKQLFVPVDKLQESLKQIQVTGSALNTALRSLRGV